VSDAAFFEHSGIAIFYISGVVYFGNLICVLNAAVGNFGMFK